MLKRLVILNSDIYAKADIELGDSHSIQIVGPNNIGKSTLIYALNFLYIIDGKQMTFSGGRTGDKTTINHYFPSLYSSYIVFEIFKQRYYSILVKKNTEGSLDYYKIDSDYKEDLYFKQTEKGQQLEKFDALLSRFSTQGIEYRKFSNRREVFNFVYQKGKRNNGVVWIKQNIAQDARGISNSFSKIYRYLINSKLIDNKALKNALIIADNRDNEKVEFSKKNQKDIRSLLKLNNGIKVIKSIRTNYTKFKALVEEYKGKRIMISNLVFAFNHRYIASHSDLDLDINKHKKQRTTYVTQVNDSLSPALQKHNQKIGRLSTQIELKEKEIFELQKEIGTIEGFEALHFLEQARFNLDKERKDIESQLTQIENQDLSSKAIEVRIQQANNQLGQLTRQIENYSNLLVHQITANQEDKELINRILSNDILSLSQEHIIQKITSAKEIMKLFDGSIQIPESIKGKKIASIEELRAKVKELEKEKAANEKLLPIALDLEKYQKSLREINTKIRSVEAKVEKLKELPKFKAKLKQSDLEKTQWIAEKVSSEKETKLITEEIRRINESIKILDQKIIKKEQRVAKIQEWKIEIEQSGVHALGYHTEDTLDNLYLKFRKNREESIDLHRRKGTLFENLKYKTETSYASEEDFMQYIDSELATLEDKQRSIEGLLKNLSTQFANPCRTIHSRYQEFSAFINNEFNSKLRKIKISDIDSLKIELVPNDKLMDDLEKIMSIRDLSSELIFDDQSKNLEVLNKYLDNQTTIFFKDLFDIKLHLDKKGLHKVVNLKNQIESDGTDKIIRLVIIMSIINRLVVNDTENKVVLFVDEIGTIDEANRIEMLAFCKMYNFVPISAAPLHPYDGFDRYYLIRRSKGKIVVSEKNGNVILRKNIAAK